MTVLERLGLTLDGEQAAALFALGLDVRRLRFLRWLVTNGRDPEWVGVRFSERANG